MNPMQIFIAARETAIEEYISKLSQEPDPHDPGTKQRIAEETGLDLFGLTTWELEQIEKEVSRRW